MSRHEQYRQNAADQPQVEAAEKLRLLRIQQERNDLIVALRSPEVRRVLWRVIDECRVFSETWTGEAAQLSFDAGKRAVARFLMELLDSVDDKAVLEMRQMARDRARREQLEIEAAATRPD